MNPLESPEIMKSIYDFAVKHFSDFRTQYGEKVSCRYDPDQLSAFVILGFWGLRLTESRKRFRKNRGRKTPCSCSMIYCQVCPSAHLHFPVRMGHDCKIFRSFGFNAAMEREWLKT